MKSFLDLPDELILKVFSYTKRVDHWRCSRVCKRIRNISKDNSLIPKVNLMDLPYEAILKVLSYTEIADLLSCGLVSKRFRNVSDDNSLLSNSQLLKKIHAQIRQGFKRIRATSIHCSKQWILVKNISVLDFL